MKKAISIWLVLIMVLSTLILSGCAPSEEATSTTKEKEYQEKLMSQANDKVGMPDITEFYEKKLAKEIYEKRDDSSLICYTYSQNLNGKFVYVGECMGYGLPYSTQYTNPDKYLDDPNGTCDAGSVVIPQSDPNGLYSSGTADATWLMMVDEATGENYIMYCEPNIIVTEHKIPARLIESWSLPSNY